MKTEKDFKAQADRIILGLIPKLNNLVQSYQSYQLWNILNSYFRQELLKAYNQGVQDEAQRIAQGYDNDQENDIFNL